MGFFGKDMIRKIAAIRLPSYAHPLKQGVPHLKQFTVPTRETWSSFGIYS